MESADSAEQIQGRSHLSPLAGMPLRHLSLWDFRGADLSPLRGMPLKQLNCGCSPVSDLSPLRGLPLTGLAATGKDARIASLSAPARGAPAGVRLEPRSMSAGAP